MDLILWRHADARDASDPVEDLSRPLTTKGERQAQRMAQWLNRHLPDSTRVLSSPAVRTRQTADALNRKYKLHEALGPDRSAMDLLEAARWPDARGPVLVVGHQPTLGFAAAYLTEGLTKAWVVRKGAVWWLRQREREGGPEVVLMAVIAPDQLF